MDILAGNLAANAGELAKMSDASSETSKKSETPRTDPDIRSEPTKSSNSSRSRKPDQNFSDVWHNHNEKSADGSVATKKEGAESRFGH